MSFPSKIELTGADKFILALDSYDIHEGNSGNTCRYILELDRRLELDTLKKAIADSQIMQWAASLELKGFNSNEWHSSNQMPIMVFEIASDDYIPEEVINTKQDRKQAPLFYFHLIQRSESRSAIIFSWHHLLMDGVGATLILQSLNEAIKSGPHDRKKSKITFRNFLNAREAKRFVTNGSKGTSSQAACSSNTQLKQQIHIIRFSPDETKIIQQQARKAGAKFGMGTYYLATAAQAFNSIRTQKEDLWIPIPQNNRKRGALWPVIGNHISFIFYTINAAKLYNRQTLISDLNAQMLEQIRKELPNKYEHLMNYLRVVPSNLYAWLIKGKHRTNVASFLFTTAPDHPTALDSFLGISVTDAYNLPPNSYPPGITFVINHYRDELRVIIMTYADLFSKAELSSLSESFRSLLLDIEG